MRRQTMLKMYDEVTSQKEAEHEALLAQRATLDTRITALAEDLDALARSRQIFEHAKDNFVTVRQSGTLTKQITDLMEQVLGEHGPTHRRELLQIALDAGIVVGSADKDQLNTFMSYLSRDSRFRSVGGGVWRLVASVSEPPSEDPETEPEEEGVLLRMPS